MTRRRRYVQAVMRHLRAIATDLLYAANRREKRRLAEHSGRPGDYLAGVERALAGRLVVTAAWLGYHSPKMKPPPGGWPRIAAPASRVLLLHTPADNCLESGCPRCWALYRRRVEWQRRLRARAKAAS